MRSSCAGEIFYKEHNGKRYCVLHFPGKEKSADFKIALQRKLASNNFNFCGVWFPDEQEFTKLHFRSDADFSFAVFSGWAHFNGATFSAKANFQYATFEAKVDLFHVTFAGDADFSLATFSAETYFTFVTFCAKVDFTGVTFRDHIKFLGGENYVRYIRRKLLVFEKTSSVKLSFAKIEKPEILSFHSVALRPHWFVNVDARKFDFTNVRWYWRSTKKEIGSLRDRDDVYWPHRMLAVACRRLAVNAEENHRYEEGSKLRYMAMDAGRLESLFGFAPWRLSWWYWVASGYGERAFRAFIVLIGVWLLFATLYTNVGFARWEPKRSNEKEAVTAQRDEVGEPLWGSRAFMYSLGVMALQKPEPRPATTAAQSFVILEMILGPLQAALLALAIRRKFMR